MKAGVEQEARFASCADENGFVRELHAYLGRRGWASFPQNSHVAHADSRYVPGTPDIIALAPSGVTWYLECKTDKACNRKDCNLSASQKKVRDRVSANGDYYRVIAPSFAVDMIEELESHESCEACREMQDLEWGPDGC